MYILDSSAIIELLAGSSLGNKIIALTENTPIAATVISYVEVMTGVKPKTENAATIFFESVPLFTLTEEAAEQCVDIQKQLKQEGKMMAKSDLFIVGICKQNNFSLITCDNDFLRVQEISVLLVK